MISAEDLAEYLRGTCKSKEEAIDYVVGVNGCDESEAEFILTEAEEEVTCCFDCGWWVESYECNDDGQCEGCRHE